MQTNVRLWNIGTPEEPVIQGQAAKPFSHQKGPTIQFPQEVSRQQGQTQVQKVNNACLCKYRYYRYYAIYAYAKPASGLKFYKAEDTAASYDYNEEGFPIYTLQTRSGYQWELLTGYQYLGCFPKGTFNCGVWEKINLPYGTIIDNLPFPSPSWLTNDNPWESATLLRMVVNSYKCCNGYHGCGLRYAGEDDEWLQTSGYFCQGIYTVRGLRTQNPTAVLEPGSQHCGLGHQRDFEDPINCDTMKVRVYHPFIVLPDTDPSFYCPECFQTLQETAISHAQVALQECVIWRLWAIRQCVCNKPPEPAGQPWSLVVPDQHLFQRVPQTVWGKGQGELPENAHTEERQDLCYLCGTNTFYTIYKWKKYPLGTTTFDPPENLTQHICKECIDPNDPFKNVPPTQDPIPGSQEQPPCNTPNPPPQLYKELDYELFNVYKATLTKTGDGGTGGYYSQNECRDVWTFSQDEQGHINWTLQDSDKKDYQIYELWPPKVQDDTQTQGGKVIYLVVRAGEEPPETATELSQIMGDDFFDGQKGPSMYGQNKCKHYWDICFDCTSTQVPCPPSYLGQLPPSYIQDNNLCQDVWRVAPLQSSCMFLYMMSSQKAQWCQEDVAKANSIQYPSLNFQFRYKVYTPQCQDHQNVVHESEWRTFTKTFTAQQVIQKGFCSSSPSFQDGFYIPCPVPEQCEESDTETDCSGLLSEFFIEPVIPAPIQDDVIIPGRLELTQDCSQEGDKEPICRVYYIHYTGSYWDPVTVSPDEAEDHCNVTLKDLFQRDKEEDPDIPLPDIDFQLDCGPLQYGVSVALIGWSVFKGIAFEQETVQNVTKWYYKGPWRWNKVYASKEEFEYHHPGYIMGVSGFYTATRGICVQDTGIPTRDGWAPAEFSINQQGCAAWAVQNGQTGQSMADKCTLYALVLARFGYSDPCQDKVQVPMHYINAINTTVSAYIGTQIPQKTQCTMPANLTLFYAYDCSYGGQDQSRNIFKRMQQNGDLSFKTLARKSCTDWDESEKDQSFQLASQRLSEGLCWSWRDNPSPVAPFGTACKTSLVPGRNISSDLQYQWEWDLVQLCAGPVAGGNPYFIWFRTADLYTQLQGGQGGCSVYKDATGIQERSFTASCGDVLHGRINSAGRFSSSYIEDTLVPYITSANNYKQRQIATPFYLYDGTYSYYDAYVDYGSYSKVLQIQGTIKFVQVYRYVSTNPQYPGAGAYGRGVSASFTGTWDESTGKCSYAGTKTIYDIDYSCQGPACPAPPGCDLQNIPGTPTTTNISGQWTYIGDIRLSADGGINNISTNTCPLPSVKTYARFWLQSMDLGLIGRPYTMKYQYAQIPLSFQDSCNQFTIQVKFQDSHSEHPCDYDWQTGQQICYENEEDCYNLQCTYKIKIRTPAPTAWYKCHTAYTHASC